MPSARLRAPLRAAFAGVGVVLAVPLPAAAEAPCPIRLTPADAAPAWREAVDLAAARLLRLSGPQDCRAVEVSVAPTGGATLAFLTTDGRGAARALESPAELAPTLEALLVTRVAPVEPSAPPPPPAPLPAETRAPVAPRPTPLVVSTPPAAPTPRAVELHVAAALGARLAWSPVTHVAPTLALRPSVGVGHWELGAFVDYVPVHEPAAATVPAGFALSSLATGVFVGARTRASAWLLGCGAAVGVQSVNEEADDVPELALSRTVDVAQPRLGAYGKASYPADSALRFVTELGFDAVLGRERLKATDERHLPGLPRFGLGLSLGVEATLL